MINSNFSSWASYCLPISDFQPIGKSGAACFAYLLLKFCWFQPDIKAENLFSLETVGFDLYL